MYKNRTFVCDTIEAAPDAGDPPFRYQIDWNQRGQTRDRQSVIGWWNMAMIMTPGGIDLSAVHQWALLQAGDYRSGVNTTWTDPDGYPGEEFWNFVIEDEATRTAWFSAAALLWNSTDGFTCCAHHVDRITETGQIPDFVISEIRRDGSEPTFLTLKMGNIDDGSDFTEEGTFVLNILQTGVPPPATENFTKLDQIDQVVTFDGVVNEGNTYVAWVTKDGRLRSGRYPIDTAPPP